MLQLLSLRAVSCAVCQMNKDGYLDPDRMLEAILAHERERRERRRQNNDGVRNAEAIR